MINTSAANKDFCKSRYTDGKPWRVCVPVGGKRFAKVAPNHRTALAWVRYLTRRGFTCIDIEKQV